MTTQKTIPYKADDLAGRHFATLPPDIKRAFQELGTDAQAWDQLHREFRLMLIEEAEQLLARTILPAPGAARPEEFLLVTLRAEAAGAHIGPLAAKLVAYGVDFRVANYKGRGTLTVFVRCADGNQFQGLRLQLSREGCAAVCIA